MVGKVNIVDGGSNRAAAIHISSEDEAGILCFVKNRDERTIVNKPFINSTKGLSMAVDGSGTPAVTENVHDGTDNVYWTASALSGTWDFASTTQNHTPAGTKSIDATSTIGGDTARINKGSTFDMSTIENLTGWVYLTAWSTSGTKGINIWFNDSGGSIVGNLVDISGYIDTGLIGSWQQFIIPKTIFGISGQSIQSIDIQTVDIGAGPPPDYYLDDLSMNDASTGFEYSIEPDVGSNLHLTRIKFVMRDAYNVTTSNQHGLDLAGFMGVGALTNGILAKTTRGGVIVGSGIIKGFSDWMGFPQFENLVSGGNGTNTWVTFELTFKDEGGLTLRSDKSDVFSYVIRDDLSGLLQFQAIAEGYVVINEADNG